MARKPRKNALPKADALLTSRKTKPTPGAWRSGMRVKFFTDDQPFPFDYGSDLHWLWGWGQRLHAWLSSDRPAGRLDWMIFRPDRSARAAITRLGEKHPAGIRQVQDSLGSVELAWAKCEVGKSNPDSIEADNFVGALLCLADRIRTACQIIAEEECRLGQRPKEIYFLQSRIEKIFAMKPKAVKGFCLLHNIPTKQESRRFRVSIVPFITAYAQDINVRTDAALRHRVAKAMQKQEIVSKLDAATAQFFGT